MVPKSPVSTPLTTSRRKPRKKSTMTWLILGDWQSWKVFEQNSHNDPSQLATVQGKINQWINESCIWKTSNIYDHDAKNTNNHKKHKISTIQHPTGNPLPLQKKKKNHWIFGFLGWFHRNRYQKKNNNPHHHHHHPTAIKDTGWMSHPWLVSPRSRGSLTGPTSVGQDGFLLGFNLPVIYPPPRLGVSLKKAILYKPLFLRGGGG